MSGTTTSPTGTLPFDEPQRAGEQREIPLLVRIGQCHRPLDPEPQIFDLSALDQLHFGRAEGASSAMAGKRSLDLRQADPWMSQRHARIVRFRSASGDFWILEDLGSTNGCRVNNVVTTRHQLTAGDLVETGQTFWRFCTVNASWTAELLPAAYAGGPIDDSSSVAIAQLARRERARQLAATTIPLIILGPSGTGKEVLARQVHRWSSRSGDCVTLNCPAIPEGLIESELFGHRRGAFTGALEDKPGVVQAAHRGTLLLDEVGDMPLGAQAKVLRLLQDGSVQRIGEATTRRIDVRFIAATHRNLEQLVDQGRFRGDLFARLNGACVTLPPLTERIEDLGLLIARFLAESAVSAERLSIDREVYRALLGYSWPFNVRELQKVIISAVALAGQGDHITTAHLPATLLAPAKTAAPTGATPARPLAAHARPSEAELRELVVTALTKHQGNISACARELGTSRMQVHRWMRRLDVAPSTFREPEQPASEPEPASEP